jgi:CRP-like cAMP-binding protein
MRHARENQGMRRRKNPASLAETAPLDDYLADVAAFSMLSTRQRRRLATIATRREIPGGESIMADGDTGAECIVVLYGSVEIRDGKRLVAQLERGGCYGELDLLARRPGAKLEITATSPAVVDVIGARDFFRLLLEAPVLAEGLVIGLARCLREVGEPYDL